MSCLHGKPPQVAEYRRGLSRASNRAVPILMPGEGRAVPPVYPRACVGTPSFTQLASFAKKYLLISHKWTSLPDHNFFFGIADTDRIFITADKERDGNGSKSPDIHAKNDDPPSSFTEEWRMVD